MKVDVRGTDLAAFKAISDGKYNLGSVVLAGQDGLSKVNNHHILRNSHANSADENRAVREALYRAICNHQRERPLDAECLAAIRAKLGLNETGHVSEAGENAVGARALTRRDIKQIIAFTEQGKTSADIFKAARENVQAMIAAAQLPEKERIVLKMNLLNDNGKLACWQRVFDTRLVNTLKFIDPQTAPTANAIGDQTSRLAEEIRNTCQNFIQSFVTFAETARAQITAKTDELRNAVNIQIEGSELNQLAQNDDEQRETDALFARLRNAPAETSRLLEGRLLIRLSALTFDDVTGANVEQTARAFVDGLMPAQNDFLARTGNHLALQTQKINARLRTEALAAKQAIESGRTAMEAEMAKTDEQFTAFQKHLDLLKSTFADLAEKHPRADERLDGDAITAALEELANAFNKVLDEKTALAKKVSDESGTLTADNVGTRRQEVSDACERLVAKAQTAIDAKIDELNGKLKLTVVPKFGEDPAAAAQATQAKRAALTEKLEAEWAKTADEFTQFLDKFLAGSKEDFVGLNPEERRTFDGLVNDLRARFGETNRKAFVEGHGVGDAKPSDLFTKAKLDALKIVDNARRVHFAAIDRALQTKFAALEKWLDGKTDDFASEFKLLTGCSIASLAGNNPNRLKGLKRMTVALVRRLAPTIDAETEKIRLAKEADGPVYTTLADIQKELNANMAALVSELSEPGRLERAGKEPEVRADAMRDFDTSVRNILKELKIAADSPLGLQLEADAARVRKGFELHILNEYVYAGESPESLAPLAKNLLDSFRTLAEARKVREDLLSAIQKELSVVSDKFFYTSKNAPDEKLTAQNKFTQTLYSALQQDGNNVGVEKTLTLNALKAMAKKSLLSGISMENVAKGLAEGDREMSLAEDAMRLGRDLPTNGKIGAALEAPALDAGLDGLLVDPQVPIEDPRPQPAFDRIIQASN